MSPSASLTSSLIVASLIALPAPRGMDSARLATGAGEWRDRTTFLMNVDELGNLGLFGLTVVFPHSRGRVFITVENPYPWNPDPTVLLTGRWQP